MDHASLVEQKGAAVIAAKVDVPVTHVRVWKNRGIPRSRYADIITAFPDITLDMLKAGEGAKA